VTNARDVTSLGYAVLKNARENRMADLKVLFDLMDLDGDGIITPSELLHTAISSPSSRRRTTIGARGVGRTSGRLAGRMAGKTSGRMAGRMAGRASYRQARPVQVTATVPLTMSVSCT